ncbi:MAG: hypothetical protein GKR93_05090 [Gammaproteobacteria bacterium]|nr:hypothetical protein [Gammaproteobacteria bacterium]
MKVGFLFNHYLSYQVIHGAPVAFELSRLKPEIKVDLLFSSESTLKEAHRIAAVYPEHNCSFSLLPGSRILATRFPSLHRPLVLWRNRKLLTSYDALVAPEKNFISLKLLPAFKKIKFIGLRHGAGDRPVSFNKGRLKFDYVLVPGQSYYDRFSSELAEGCCRIIGYPKFEALEKLKPSTSRFFENDKPVVLYTPHFHPRQSSWLKMGKDVLEFFAKSSKYNLIFAPHIRLFKHKRYHGSINIDSFRNCTNILIDTGSVLSTDMTYTRSTDIYLGDVSSQVYEFLYYRQRPCIFLNPNELEETNLKFWKTGDVIKNSLGLKEALNRTETVPDEALLQLQKQFVDEAFDRNDKPSSVRGAESIIHFIQMDKR